MAVGMVAWLLERSPWLLGGLAAVGLAVTVSMALAQEWLAAALAATVAILVVLAAVREHRKATR